jgi:hypothetical protein
MITNYIMTENLNQLREKQLLGVKYGHIEYPGVNFDYLLMSVIVIHYQLSLHRVG